MNLQETDINSIKKNILLNKKNIKLSESFEDNSNFILYIEMFCIENNIDFKRIDTSITIYSSDYYQIDSSKIDSSKYNTRLIAWDYNHNDYMDYDEENIINIYWIDDLPNINSFQDLENLLLSIKNNKCSEEFYKNQYKKEI